MKQYLELLEDVLENGVEHDDRTGTGTLSVFGRQMRFDLTKAFPICTTKKVFWRGIVEELLWMVVRGSTDVTELEDRGVNFWSEWKKEDGTIGPGYGEQFRRQTHWHSLKDDWESEYPATGERLLPKFETLTPYEDKENLSLVGEEFTSSTGRYKVIKEIMVEGTKKVQIQFEGTGYSYEVSSLKSVREGSVRDRYAKTFLGIGSLGEPTASEDFDQHYQLWVGMMKRCYDENHIGYMNYGGRGVVVCDRWLVFSNFVEDIKRLPNWNLKLEYPKEYTLDKDVLGEGVYAPDTCMWLSHDNQSVNQRTSKTFIAHTPSGDCILSRGLKKFCREYGLTSTCVSNCLSGKQKTHKGFRFENIDTDKYRTIEIDQVKNIIASIRQNPNSRRHVISLWNPKDLSKMSLVPCHGNLIQFFVEQGKLSCMMTQRSGDMFLGVPFNFTFYSLLTHMIAQVCDLEAGEFIHSIGNAHIYVNHIDQVREQLTREPKELPLLWMNPWVKDINDFTADDFKLIGYKHHPAIKAPIAV